VRFCLVVELRRRLEIASGRLYIWPERHEDKLCLMHVSRTLRDDDGFPEVLRFAALLNLKA
jgi:hypothetical protein